MADDKKKGPNPNLIRLDRGIRQVGQTIKDYAPVARGVAKTFLFQPTDPANRVDYGPGPTPEPKTPGVPKQWYKDTPEHGVPSYKDGVDRVPKDGPAFLHEGEKVISKEDNMASSEELKKGVSKVASALGSAGVQPDDDSARGIAEKNAMIDQYKQATQTPASEPKPAPKTSAVDKINPKARYGDRGKEKRIDTKEMTKPIPSYSDGVASVPKDGVAMLHEGEKVVPEKDNPDSHKKKSRVSESMGGSKKSPKLKAKKGSKKTVHHVTVHKSSNGGVVLQHEYEDGSKDMAHHPDFDSAAAAMAPHFDQPEGAAPPQQQMAEPASFEDGGVVKKDGMAQVHEGEVVVPKDQAHKVFQNPDITIGGGRVAKGQKPIRPKMTPELREKQRQYEDPEHGDSPWMTEQSPSTAKRSRIKI